MPLETEIRRYQELLPELLISSKDKFVVIKGSELLGVFESMDVAYRAALDAYGVVPFLLRQVLTMQPVLKRNFAYEFGILVLPRALRQKNAEDSDQPWGWEESFPPRLKPQ